MRAVHEQEFNDGQHPILFISKKLSGAECNYAVVEKGVFCHCLGGKNTEKFS